MNRLIVSFALCAMVVMAGCKDRSKTEDAKASATPPTPAAPGIATIPHAPTTPKTPTPTPAVVAVSTANLTGSWKQVGGDANGTTVVFDANGTFTSHVKTGWKKKEEPKDLEMRGKWKLDGKHIVLTDLFVGTSTDDMELITLPPPPTTMPVPSATTQESFPPIRPVHVLPKLMTETDTIISVSPNAFKTLDEDGETRSYERAK